MPALARLLFMKEILDIAIPVVAIIMMFIVGLSLTGADFRRVKQNSNAVFAGLLGQGLLIPVLALILTQTFSLHETTAAGILLLAICPGGGISNFYCYLAYANTALSVTLTALSCLSVVATMPLWLLGYEWLLGQPFAYAIPFKALLLQLIFLICVPIFLGMLGRYWRPVLAQRYEPLLRRVGYSGVVCLVAFVIFQVRDQFVQELAQTVPVALAFMGLTVAAGLGVGWLCGLDARERLTLAIEYPVRNLAIMLVIAITVFERVEFASFGAAYFLVEVAIIVALIMIFSRSPTVPGGKSMCGAGRRRRWWSKRPTSGS